MESEESNKPENNEDGCNSCKHKDVIIVGNEIPAVPILYFLYY